MLRHVQRAVRGPAFSKRSITSHGFKNADGHSFSMAKIVGTIGPVSEDAHTTQLLVNAGLKIARINFSHATYEEAELRTVNLRAARGVHGAHGSEFNLRSVLLDTQGPEIRGGSFADGNKVTLTKGDQITLTTDERFKKSSTKELLYVTYAKLAETVSPGSTVLLDDGLISLTVESIENGQVHCRVENTETLGNRKGVNLPGLVVDLPALTDKDKADVEFGIKHDMDFVAVSFVRSAADIHAVQEFVKATMIKYWPADHPSPKLIAKIENHQGVSNFDEILDVADGIMVARGDLGVEIPLAEVFTCQKMMVSKANAVGKPVIVATQMLDSMIRNPRPTRSEILDVGNAVLDGADCVMLSGEVAQGKYPVESVSTMLAIIKEGENFMSRFPISPPVVTGRDSLASAAVNVAYELKAKLIVALTKDGTLARDVAKYKPSVPVMSYTPSRKVGRQLQLHRGLYPVVSESMTLEEALEDAVKMGWTKKGDKVVVLSNDDEETPQQFIMRIETVA
ncbi:pyruvate kinase [Aphanomyces invadans]|uniref:Pyruvate kinase n=1 Tax=Aphanomyces invadans TaxID=157072 RepID=A0A024TTT0_9STRA|nr:pyruvate kinase [Aphanomyces invadans]ETV97041.1 pyruvate kinase [Aphanomyces invadans]|eukprot:XP_008874287.1 pyruvate kinase [Aphanomyces invadans]